MRQTVNPVLRTGLAVLAASARPKRAAFRTPTVSLGKPRLASLDDVASVLAFAEADALGFLGADLAPGKDDFVGARRAD